MKEFLNIFLTNLVPSKRFLKDVATGMIIIIAFFIPLVLTSLYTPSYPYKVTVEMLIAYAELYILIVGVRSWEQYKRGK